MPSDAPPPAPVPGPPERLIRGSDLTAYFFGGLIYMVVVGSGILNILAAAGSWNPLHWKGRLWTGIFMVAAPTAIAVMTALPLRIRQQIPESVGAVAILALWIAFFWAACGGH